MKRMTWISLPLALVLGCHHNLCGPRSCDVSGAGAGAGVGAGAGASSMNRRFPNFRTQVAFVSPVGMKVGWETSMGPGGKTFIAAQIGVPSRYNFDQGGIYRLKLTDVPGHPRMTFYPTLEIAPSTPRTDAYLTHNAVPIEFTDEDFDQVTAGNFVTKVIYLPDPQHQELAIAGVETLVSTRLDPGVDPIAEADRRGTILAIIRLGGIDLEMAQSPGVSAIPYPPAGPTADAMTMVSPEPSGQTVLHPQMVMEPESQSAIIRR